MEPQWAPDQPSFLWARRASGDRGGSEILSLCIKITYDHILKTWAWTLGYLPKEEREVG